MVDMSTLALGTRGSNERGISGATSGGMSERKIFGVPRVPLGMLARRALLERIGRTPLTGVRAPGGAGKTVLLAQWAAAHESAGVWVTIEPGIGRRAAFWNTVFEAVAALGAIPPVRFDESAEVDGIRRSLLRAFRGVMIPFVLVIDDAH